MCQPDKHGSMFDARCSRSLFQTIHLAEFQLVSPVIPTQDLPTGELESRGNGYANWSLDQCNLIPVSMISLTKGSSRTKSSGR